MFIQPTHVIRKAKVLTYIQNRRTKWVCDFYIVWNKCVAVMMVRAHVISLSDFHKSSRNPPCCHFLGLKSSEIKHFRPTHVAAGIYSYKVKYLLYCHGKNLAPPFFRKKNKTTHLEKTFWPTPKMYLIVSTLLNIKEGIPIFRISYSFV